MTAQSYPTEDEIRSLLRDRNKWGRWGQDDQAGAINLITPEKRAAAAGLVRSGRTVSLSRPFPTTPAPNTPNPAQHWMRSFTFPGGGGAAVDYYAISYHGQASTHIDALCHVWNADGLWNGRTPEQLTPTGARWGSVDNWSNGIITRGILVDVPRARGEPFVTQDRPVTGEELESIAAAAGLNPQSGDALIVYSGREEYSRANSSRPWGTPGEAGNPGLHASCLKPIRDWDVAVLVWDMMDLRPSGYDVRWTVHGALPSYGVALVDNALLQPLSEACAAEGRYEFMLLLAPLVVAGGTGSPLNPIAMF
jgi:kynurenine formamidase